MSDTRMLVGTNAGFQTGYATAWGVAKGYVQSVINAYDALSYDPLANIADVASLVADPEQFIFLQQTGGGAKIIGSNGDEMPINIAVAKTLIIKPAGYAALQTAIATLLEKSKEGITTGPKDDNYKPYVKGFADLAANFVFATSTLSFSTARQTKIDEAGNLYAVSDKGKAIATFLNDVAESLATNAAAMGYSIDPADVNLKFDYVQKIFDDCLKSFNLDAGEANLRFNSDGVNPLFYGDR